MKMPRLLLAVLATVLLVDQSCMDAFASVANERLDRRVQLWNEALRANSLLNEGQDEASMEVVIEVLVQLSRDPRLNHPRPNSSLRLWDITLSDKSRTFLNELVQTSDRIVKRRRLNNFTRLVELLEQCAVKCFGPNDPLFVRIHIIGATVAGATNDKDKRRDELRKAFEIACWAWGAGSTDTINLRAAYVSALRDCGDKLAASTLEALPIVQVKTLHANTLYGDHVVGLCSLLPEVYTDNAENELLTYLEQIRKANGNLDSEVNNTLCMLINFYAARKRYSDAEKFLVDKLRIVQAVQKNTNFEESKTYQQIAELRYLSGDRRAALRWLNKSDKLNKPEFASITLDRAALCLEMGDKDRAANAALRVARAFQKHDAGGGPFAQCFAKCCFLLRKTGQMAELQKMNAIYEATVPPSGRDQYGLDYAGSRSTPFYRRCDGEWKRLTVETAAAKNDTAKQKLLDDATDYGTVRLHSLEILEFKRKKSVG